MTFREIAPQRPLHISSKVFDKGDAQPYVLQASWKSASTFLNHTHLSAKANSVFDEFWQFTNTHTQNTQNNYVKEWKTRKHYFSSPEQSTVFREITECL